jgi:hypothetical protein
MNWVDTQGGLAEKLLNGQTVRPSWRWTIFWTAPKEEKRPPWGMELLTA